MAKKEVKVVDQPNQPYRPIPLLCEVCGCTVYATAKGTKLERCMAHDCGPEVMVALANILDCQEEDLDGHLEAAEVMMDELLETHGGRITASRRELDGISSYTDKMSVMQLIPK